MTEKPLLDLDTLVAEVTYEPFRFVLDGREWTIPHLQALEGRVALRIEQGEATAVLRELLGEALEERVLALPAHAIGALLDAWLKHAGIESGNSSASPRS